MSLSLSYNDFWRFAMERLKQRNYLSYHPCCDVWTTRNSKCIKETHTSVTSWKEVMATLDKSVEDGQVALQAKMLEEGWQIPVVVNKPCRLNPNSSLAGKRGPKTKYKQVFIEPPFSGQMVPDYELPDQSPMDKMHPSGNSSVKQTREL